MAPSLECHARERGVSGHQGKTAAPPRHRIRVHGRRAPTHAPPGAEALEWASVLTPESLRGDGAQVVQRAAEQVLAQVEQAGPERAGVDRRCHCTSRTSPRAHARARRAPGRRPRCDAERPSRLHGRGPAASRRAQRGRVRRTTSGLRRGPPRAPAGSGRAAPRARRAQSRRGPPRGGAQPGAGRASTGRPRRAPSARAAGKTRARRPRRRELVDQPLAVDSSTACSAITAAHSAACRMVLSYLDHDRRIIGRRLVRS